MKHILTLKPNNIKIQAEEGTYISQALMPYAKLPMICGGKGLCGKCKVLAEGEMSPLTEEEKIYLPKGYRLACTTKILGNVTVFVPEISFDQSILTHNYIRKTKINNNFQNCFGIAFDIGSTTIAAYLVNMDSGKIIKSSGALNPQIFYGEDLISRIDYINTHKDGLSILQNSVISVINDLIKILCDENIQSIKKAVFVGNTCMNHILLGVNPCSLGIAPYEPVFKESKIIKASDLNINIEGDLYFFPNMAGFVGGDTVAVILACMENNTAETTLAVDIGTNGETVLRHKGKIYVCSAAGGPAFEGGGISCGMRGTVGAIDKVFIENNKIKYHTVGDSEPKGICGSGLVDLICVLVEKGIIDKTGRMKENFVINEKVYLTPKDVRNLQLAKGSVNAAILTLLSYADVSVENVDKLYLAGGFGNYLNIKSAVDIGLLPKVKNIIPVGNGAGSGAVLALINDDEWERAKEIGEEGEHVELAQSSDYENNLMESMFFRI